MTVIETERLLLREFVPGDVELLAPIFADAEMMRYYPAPFSRERTQGWIDWNMGHYRERGHGLWALVRREDGLFLGDCGIAPQPIEGEEWLEIGYHVRREEWGKGYATEAARACRDYAFDQLGAARVCSIVHPENEASRLVAAKVHQHTRMFFWDKIGREMRLFFSARPTDRQEIQGA